MHAISVSIQQTLRDFRAESSDWENEVLALFNDVDRFVTSRGETGGVSPHADVTEDIVGLRGLVEQQTEVLTALVNALTEPAAAPTDVAMVRHERTSELSGSESGAELDPFERLQRAVAAASEAS